VITTYSYDTLGARTRRRFDPSGVQDLTRWTVTTYSYGIDAFEDRRGSDEMGWLIRAPNSEFGWELPDATHVGGIGRPGDLAVITIFIGAYSGLVDHIAGVATFDWDFYDAFNGRAIRRTLKELCQSIHKAPLSELVKSHGDAPQEPVDARLLAATDLAKVALIGALAHRRFEGTKAD
jgi:hypothetical protein